MVMLNKKEGQINIKCPSVPNFIKIDGNYKPLTYFSEKELKIVADEWKSRLLEKRKRKIVSVNEQNESEEN